MGRGRKKSGRRRSGSGLGEWIGKKIIVVEKSSGARSDLSIFNLKEGKVMKGGGELLNHSCLYGLAGVGSVIYAFGKYMLEPMESIENPDEQDLLHSGVSLIDLSVTPKKWKHFEPELICKEREDPSCLALGHFIFAFGGTNTNTSSTSSPEICFGEFYDVANPNQGWRLIPLSPIPRIDHPVLSDPKNHRLICFCGVENNTLFAYYPDQDGWEILGKDTDWLSWCRQPATSPVDDVIYFYSERECITAYHITALKRLDVSWTTKTPFSPHVLYCHPLSEMLYLGENIICYISFTPFKHPSPEGYQTNLHFFRFQVCRISDQEATVTPLSSHTIPVQGNLRPCNYAAL